MSLRGEMRNVSQRAFGALVRQMTADSARILMYHRFGAAGDARRIDVHVFEDQLAFLRKHFRPTSLREVVDRLSSGRSLAARTVVLTIDDGYKDFLEYAVPVLEKYRVPATVYVVSRFVDRSIWLWVDALRWLVYAASPGPHKLSSLGTGGTCLINSTEDREQLWLHLTDLCSRVGVVERSGIIQSVERDLWCSLPARPVREYESMTWDDLRSLDRELIEVGAHTATHPILGCCSQEEQVQEIAECKDRIEEQLRCTVESFCYPNGMPGDFSEGTIEALRSCGFRNAVTASGGFVDRDSDVYQLSRIAATDDMRLFRNAVNGLWQLRDWMTPPARS